MGKYEQAYDEFIAKYDLNLNIQTEYDGANRLASIDDFSMDTSPERKAQNVYISTLSSALTDYISKKVKIESGKSHELANFDVRDFVTEFDKVMEAIRSDKADAENTEYTHRQFEGLPLDRVANDAWTRVAPGYNKTLPTLWKEQMKSGRLKIEDARLAVHSLHEKLTAKDAKKEELTGELKNIVAAREAMRQLRESRKGFIGFFWKLFNREQNKQEKDLLSLLETEVNELKGPSYNYDVDGVFYEATRETPFGESELQRTNAQDLSAYKRPEEELVIQNREQINPEQINQEINLSSVASNEPVVEQKDLSKEEKIVIEENKNELENKVEPKNEAEDKEEPKNEVENKEESKNEVVVNEPAVGNQLVDASGKDYDTFLYECVYSDPLSLKVGEELSKIIKGAGIKDVNEVSRIVEKAREASENIYGIYYPDFPDLESEFLEEFMEVAFETSYEALENTSLSTKDKIVTAQKMTNVFTRNYSPAAYDADKYSQYTENYVVNNNKVFEAVAKHFKFSEAERESLMSEAAKEVGAPRALSAEKEIERQKQHEEEQRKAEESQRKAEEEEAQRKAEEEEARRKAEEEEARRKAEEEERKLTEEKLKREEIDRINLERYAKVKAIRDEERGDKLEDYFDKPDIEIFFEMYNSNASNNINGYTGPFDEYFDNLHMNNGRTRVIDAKFKEIIGVPETDDNREKLKTIYQTAKNTVGEICDIADRNRRGDFDKDTLLRGIDSTLRDQYYLLIYQLTELKEDMPLKDACIIAAKLTDLTFKVYAPKEAFPEGTYEVFSNYYMIDEERLGKDVHRLEGYDTNIKDQEAVNKLVEEVRKSIGIEKSTATVNIPAPPIVTATVNAPIEQPVEQPDEILPEDGNYDVKQVKVTPANFNRLFNAAMEDNALNARVEAEIADILRLSGNYGDSEEDIELYAGDVASVAYFIPQEYRYVLDNAPGASDKGEFVFGIFKEVSQKLYTESGIDAHIIEAQKITDIILKNYPPISCEQEDGVYADNYIIKNPAYLKKMLNDHGVTADKMETHIANINDAVFGSKEPQKNEDEPVRENLNLKLEDLEKPAPKQEISAQSKEVLVKENNNLAK